MTTRGRWADSGLEMEADGFTKKAGRTVSANLVLLNRFFNAPLPLPKNTRATAQRCDDARRGRKLPLFTSQILETPDQVYREAILGETVRRDAGKIVGSAEVEAVEQPATETEAHGPLRAMQRS